MDFSSFLDNIDKIKRRNDMAVVKKVRGHITEVDKDFSMVKVKENNYLRLDIACGNNKQKGFTGIDITKTGTQADMAIDLEKYPWKQIKTSSVSEIHCSHYIEHVSDLRKFAGEIHRILIPKGKVIFIAPYYSSIRAMQDPTHKNFISEATFLYWNKNWMDTNGLSHYGIDANFNIENISYSYNQDWILKSDIAKEYARIHYINVVSDITATLRVIK